MEVIDVIKKRYAAKSFSGEKISDSQLKQLKESIKFAPSYFNWQPWKIKIVTDKEILSKLQEASYNQPQIGTASHLFIFCSMNNLIKNNKKLKDMMKSKMPEDKFKSYTKMLNSALTNMTPKSQRQMSERELFMPAQNLLLTATDIGLAACPMGGFEHKKYIKILNIPKYLTPIVVIPVGMANDKPREKFRFNDEDIFF